MEEFENDFCLQSYIWWRTAYLLPTNSLSANELMSFCKSSAQTRLSSPLCFRHGINQQILSEVGMRSEIKRAAK